MQCKTPYLALISPFRVDWIVKIINYLLWRGNRHMFVDCEERDENVAVVIVIRLVHMLK